MYNQIVGYITGVADADRVLEYTDDGARLHVAPNGQVDVDRALGLPTLVMPETGSDDERQVAKIGRLTRLTKAGKNYRYEFEAESELPSTLIVEAASALGIQKFEFSRHHWAFKDADLHAVLLAHLSSTSELEDILERVSQLLVGFSEGDVDAFLSAVGAATTRSRWAERPRAVRRLELKELIRALAPKQVEFLEKAINDELADLAWQAVSDPMPTSGSADGASPTSAGVRPSADVSAASRPTVDLAGPIFVVHGHDRANLHLAVRVLQNSTGREVVVLHEQPNKGRTILEKFEQHAAAAAFAVVLLTADDVGGIAGSGSPQKRGRQNVIFEMGFFFAHLGRERVVVLVDDGIEKPSDISGLVYIALDSAGAWKQELGRELAAASIPVDYSRMP